MDTVDIHLENLEQAPKLQFCQQNSYLSSKQRCEMAVLHDALFQISRHIESDKMAASLAKYETLLRRTNQDEMLKNWGLTLAVYLDDFMAHLNDHDQMNFSEAAMLLQNSTTFYCKRVDVVHKIIQELVDEVNNLKGQEENAEGKKSGPTARRKKVGRSLELDDLQIMDFVVAEHSNDESIEKIVFRGVQKQIVLCTSMKALRKGGTSVAVYQSNGTMLGCKEEFRIFSRTYSDGTVNEDFNFDCEQIINRVDECQEDEDFDDIRDDSFHMDHEEMAPEAILPDPEPELSTVIPQITAVPLSPSLPVTAREFAAATKPKRKKNYDWEPFPFDLKARLKPFKVIHRIVLPKMIESEETTEEAQAVACRKRRRNKDKVKDEQAIFSAKLAWIDIAIDDGLVKANNRRIQIELETRKELNKSQMKALQSNIPDDDIDPFIGADDDHEPDDFENLMDDNEAAIHAAPLTQIDEIINEESPNLYGDEALKAIEKFKENRREHAIRATEVAKRVAAWHESIMPVLDAAESRSQFDVHEYGSRILTSFPDDDHKSFRPFRSVVVEQPKNEICRYFLSTLMLANTYNLEIRKSEPEPLAKDCVELRLITKVRHHEEMDEALRVAAEECGS
ncbi:hypothetical protein GE061_011623 [Apolygus lucorum]|uniref:Condensin-2 complex subunit H2 C-terminal domain-containing protein n=1 Tax=Apolygus lucorum TaxID=248454 RepID=A0A8S9Y045_APOLU|nr:hypothetical protein GE061_011623 [Apolygus lucorum]